MTTDDIQSTVREIAGKVFSAQFNPEVAAMIAAADFDFDQLGADSIDSTDFCFKVEEALGVQIEVSDLVDYPTLTSFVAMIERRKQAA
jgi:acyl carrier protein